MSEINLSDQRAAMALLFAERDRLGVRPESLRKRGRVAINSAQYWLRGDASPSIRNLVSFASALGFDVFLVQTPRASGAGPREISLTDQRGAMAALFAEKDRAGLTVFDLEVKSGISAKAAYSWRAGRQSPALANLVALAQALGFEIILRRAKTWQQ
ncbi:hypothetical protein SAMN05444389_1014 [Paracoccus solventivorans]|uniref:HTH cro/C1-type domain-containing protein n=1 Tax=Paracoccus solventivorans TaxID=53463 RepID=A0A1M7CWM9_9RHOB|nr:hypothetical protein [Paracoccus solventivorans]SHL71614.1 hypothetical protein SAMN05444389_1014 [Paracoccus solventivorans]